MPQIKARSILPVMILLASGCGLTDAKYIDYSDDEDAADGGADGSSAACPDAEAAFAAQMQSIVKSTCATAACHKLTAISGKALSADDAAINRAQLKAYTGATSDKLINKISLKGTSHGGGDQSAALPKANVDAWLAKEATCP